MLKKYGTEFILKIEDITPFVLTQRRFLEEQKLKTLKVAKERVYRVDDVRTAELIGVDNNV